MSFTWREFEPVLRDRLTRTIETQPELLLEHDGGPLGLKTDIILATLYGFDEQVDAEWRITRAEPVLLRPLPPLRHSLVDPAEASVPDIRTARYELQSNWATLNVDWLAFRDSLPPDAKPAQDTHLISVALLRYRRRA